VITTGKKVTVYKFASKEELKKQDAKIVNNLIIEGDSGLHIIAEIFEKRNRRLNPPSGTDWNKFRLLFGTKPKVIFTKNYALNQQRIVYYQMLQKSIISRVYEK